MGRDVGEDDGNQGRAPGIANTVTGTVSGPVVQAGVVHGDIRFHDSVPALEIVPQQLPLVRADLVGRADEFGVLDGWWGSGGDGSLLVALGGVGGVGKTALAASWLRRHDFRFPDGQLYVDLGGAGASEPLSASEALGRCLRALGVASEQLPPELEDRALLYRSITAGKSLAVLLDNAFSAAQARPLIPVSETSTVVVTSRVRLVGLALDGARFLDLGPLRADAAMGLLAAVLGDERVARERDSAYEICRLCSGFPLALSVSAARLAVHPQWTLSEFSARLRDQRSRLAELSVPDDVSVRAVFDACCRDLSAPAVRLYRLLSVCPAEDFPIAAVAGAAGDVDDVKGCVEELVESNLLQELTRRRYRYHDLLRVHARQLSYEEDSAPERESVKRRACEWYLDRVVGADLTVNPHRRRLGTRYAEASAEFESAEDALGWIERERTNLVAVVTETHELGWDELCWQLCEALWSFFLYRKHYQDWIITHRLGIASAERCSRPLAESRLRCQLAFAYLDLAQFDMASDLCVPALELAEAEGDRDGIATALSQLAKAQRSGGDLEGALSNFRRSLDLSEETGDRRGIALQSRRVGEVLSDLGRDAEAVESLQRAAALLADVGDQRGRARVLMFLGRAYTRVGDVEEADTTLTDALGVMRTSGSPTYQADILRELAKLAEHTGHVTVACEYWREAQVLYRDAGHPRWEEARDRLLALECRESQ